MAKVIPIKDAINWQRLRTDDAEKIIRLRARNTENVIVIGHPEDRLVERGFLMSDIYRILRTGHISKPPFLNDRGDWEVLVTRIMKGTRREAGVATIILTNDDKLIVKTIRWEDP